MPRISETRESLSSTFAALPEAYIDPSGMADGPVTGITKGALVASYGNSPASISSGKIVMVPQGVTINAAYVETILSGPVARMGLTVDFDSCTGTVALVIPAASWASAIGNSGVHATLTQAGVVSCGRYVSGALAGTQTTSVGALTGLHTYEVGVDAVRQEITVWLDGIERLKYVDPTAFSYVSNRAIWEHFTTNPDTPAKIVAAWADVKRAIPRPPNGTAIQPIRKAYAATFDPGVYTPYAIDTTYRKNLSIGTLTAVIPPSGKMLVRYRCYLDSCTGAVYGSISLAGDQQLAPSGYVGPVSCELVYTGTPGTSVGLTPQMWTGTGVAQVGVGGARGVATMAAIPLE